MGSAMGSVMGAVKWPLRGAGGGAVEFAAAGLGSVGLLNWMPAGGAWTDRGTDGETGGMRCFDMRNTAAKGGRSFVV
jgi:hypothetical protein